MTELEREVLEIINCEIEGCYIGELKVKETPYYRNYSCKYEDRCDKGVMVNVSYELLLFLNVDYEPLVMSYMYETRQYNWKKWENEPEDKGWEPKMVYTKRAQNAFKDFIKEEFKNRKLQQVDYYKLTLQLPSIDCSNE